MCTCVDEVCRELMVGLSIRGIMEEGQGGGALVVLNVLGGMVEADVVEATGTAQWAPVLVILPPLQPCSQAHFGIQTCCVSQSPDMI